MARHAKLHGDLSIQGFCYELAQDAQHAVGCLLAGA